MSVQFCLALLVLSYQTAASDPGCEELLKPLENLNEVSGKWIFHAVTSDSEASLKDLRMMNSSWIELSPTPDSDDMTLHWGDRIDGKCHHGGINFTITSNFTRVIFYIINASDHEHVRKHLVTCAGCILWIDTTVAKEEPRNSRSLYLFTKTGTLEDHQLEVFKKQAACLHFLPEFHFGETTYLCPYEEAAATEAEEKEQ